MCPGTSIPQNPLGEKFVFNSCIKLAISAIALVNITTTLRAEALTEAEVLERLKVIPVFTITDASGTPLLGSVPNQPTGENKPNQVLLFFLNPDDAQATLNQIKKNNPNLGSKARIVTRSMNDAYEVIKKNQDKKLVAFQIVPTKASVESARTLLASQGQSTAKLPNVPIFFAMDGKNQALLTIEKDGKKFVPFFFDQKDLQSLIDRAKQQQPELAGTTKIQVTSLFQVLDSMVTTKDNKPAADTEFFTFVPSSAAYKYTVNNQPKK